MLCTDLVSGYEITLLWILVPAPATFCLKIGQTYAAALDAHDARYLTADMKRVPAAVFPLLMIGSLAGLVPVASQTGCAPAAASTLVYPLVFLPAFGVFVALTTLRQRLVHPGLATPELKFRLKRPGKGTTS